MKKISVIGTLAVAIILAAAVNFYPQKADRPGGQGFRGQMFMKLNLTEEQKDKIEQLRIEHQKTMIDLRADMQKKRLAMEELMQKGNYTRTDFLKAVSDINASKDKIETARANNRMDVYDLLNDQQKKIFNDHPMMMGKRQGDRDGRCDGHGPMGKDRGGKMQRNFQ